MLGIPNQLIPGDSQVKTSSIAGVPANMFKHLYLKQHESGHRLVSIRCPIIRGQLTIFYKTSSKARRLNDRPLAANRPAILYSSSTHFFAFRRLIRIALYHQVSTTSRR
jgi:hypothetical protein